MKKITTIRILENHQVWLRFDDGVEGTVNLAREATRTGVFGAWEDPFIFRQVAIAQEGRALEWPGEIDLCADALYLRVTGKTPEEMYPSLKSDDL